jgi:hypothetical protein
MRLEMRDSSLFGLPGRHTLGVMELRAMFIVPLLLAATVAVANDKPTFDLRSNVLRQIVRKAAEPAKDPASNGVKDGDIPASFAALKMTPALSRTRTPPVPQQSTCVPVASGGPRGTEMQHVGIASDPLQSWVATQAGYIKGAVGGGSWPCSTRDAGLPSPWTR